MSKFPIPASVNYSIGENYLNGFYDYCRGYPAEKHQDYENVIKNINFDPYWVKTYQDVEAVKQGCYFDIDSALKPIKFIETLLKHIEKSFDNKPAFRKIQIMDWQKLDVIMPIFGWKNKEGSRRIRRVSIWTPKKQGKTYFVSWLGLYLLCCDNEPNANIFVSSITKKNSETIFNNISSFIKTMNSKIFKQRLHPRKYNHIIEYITPKNTSRLTCISADADNVQGYNAHVMILDELHVQKDRDFFDSIIHSIMTKNQPLFITLSTAGVYDPEAIGFQEYEYAKKIHEASVIDTSFLSYVAKVKEKDDWWNKEKEEVNYASMEELERAFPSLNVTNGSLYLRDEIQKLQHTGYESTFRRYLANQWVNSISEWIDFNKWRNCASVLNSDDYYKYLIDNYSVGSKNSVYCGLDLSTVNDMTAIVLFFAPTIEDKKPKLLPYFFLPRDLMPYLSGKNPQYINYYKSGVLKTTDGDIISFAEIANFIISLGQTFNIKYLGLDSYHENNMSQLLNGKTKIELEKISQTAYSMGPVVSDLQMRILSNEIEHNNHPILNWHVSNCQSKYIGKTNDCQLLTKRDGNIRFKIDGVYATLNALSCYIRHHEENMKKSEMIKPSIFFV